MSDFETWAVSSREKDKKLNTLEDDLLIAEELWWTQDEIKALKEEINALKRNVNWPEEDDWESELLGEENIPEVGNLKAKKYSKMVDDFMKNAPWIDTAIDDLWDIKNNFIHIFSDIESKYEAIMAHINNEWIVKVDFYKELNQQELDLLRQEEWPFILEYLWNRVSFSTQENALNRIKQLKDIFDEDQDEIWKADIASEIMQDIITSVLTTAWFAVTTVWNLIEIAWNWIYNWMTWSFDFVDMPDNRGLEYFIQSFLVSATFWMITNNTVRPALQRLTEFTNRTVDWPMTEDEYNDLKSLLKEINKIFKDKGIEANNIKRVLTELEVWFRDDASVADSWQSKKATSHAYKILKRHLNWNPINWFSWAGYNMEMAIHNGEATFMWKLIWIPWQYINKDVDWKWRFITKAWVVNNSLDWFQEFLDKNSKIDSVLDSIYSDNSKEAKNKKAQIKQKVLDSYKFWRPKFEFGKWLIPYLERNVNPLKAKEWWNIFNRDMNRYIAWIIADEIKPDKLSKTSLDAGWISKVLDWLDEEIKDKLEVVFKNQAEFINYYPEINENLEDDLLKDIKNRYLLAWNVEKFEKELISLYKEKWIKITSKKINDFLDEIKKPWNKVVLNDNLKTNILDFAQTKLDSLSLDDDIYNERIANLNAFLDNFAEKEGTFYSPHLSKILDDILVEWQEYNIKTDSYKFDAINSFSKYNNYVSMRGWFISNKDKTNFMRKGTSIWWKEKVVEVKVVEKFTMEELRGKYAEIKAILKPLELELIIKWESLDGVYKILESLQTKEWVISFLEEHKNIDDFNSYFQDKFNNWNKIRNYGNLKGLLNSFDYSKLPDWINNLSDLRNSIKMWLSTNKKKLIIDSFKKLKISPK